MSLKVVSLFPYCKPFRVRFFLFYKYGIAFRVAVTGEDRNFKFSTDVDHNKS